MSETTTTVQVFSSLLARAALLGITLAMAMVGMVHVAWGTETLLALV